MGTVAHAEAALKVRPDVSFILDIGGQDMKAIQIADGIVTTITLNEACSAGCGSFVETFARSMDIKVEQIAERAFSSNSPSRLGSRCTVFMNSSVITEQKMRAMATPFRSAALGRAGQRPRQLLGSIGVGTVAAQDGRAGIASRDRRAACAGSAAVSVPTPAAGTTLVTSAMTTRSASGSIWSSGSGGSAIRTS